MYEKKTFVTKKLDTFFQGDTSGDYKRALLAIAGYV